MKGLDLGSEHIWSFSYLLGYEHSFFTVNAHTVIQTWIILGLITCILLLARWALTKKNSVGQFLVTSVVSFFIDMTEQAIGYFSFRHFCFITTLFMFIMFCNSLSFIPGVEEPTADLNTALALGIIAFVYTQATAIYTHGLMSYFKDFFSPIFIMFPLNIVGKFASVISISFRLFGNIFGGSIITNIYFSAIKGSLLFEALGMLTGINLLIILFFSVFEGFLQAFVFSMLTLTYLSIAIQGDGH